MKQTLCSLLFLILCSKIFSQCDSVFFRYTAVAINDIAVTDANRIIAVGEFGSISKSIDAGKSWLDLPKITNSNYLRRIQMATDTVGYVVGDNKAILKTEDRGESWFPLYATIPESFSYNSMAYRDLFFFDKNKGFIIGTGNSVGVLLSTNDGGYTWKDTTITSASSINSIAFTNDSIGFICGSSSGLYKTTNAGKSWNKVTLGFLSQFETFLRVKFINSTTGFILGSNNLCLRTTDSGNSWTKINMPGGSYYTDVLFLDDLRGFIIGDYNFGLIYTTIDGGNTWNPNLNYPSGSVNFRAIKADPDKKKVFIAGGGGIGTIGSGGRVVLSTVDAGNTFEILSKNDRSTFNDAFFLNDSTGYIVGESRIALKTTDFGESWKPLTNIPALINSNEAQRIFFIDSLHGFAISDAFSKTNDGGKTWALFPGYITARRIYFYDTLKGMYLNTGGIYKTVNGGNSWQNIAVPGINQLFMDMTIRGNKIFAVGFGGVAKFSENEGANWHSINIPSRYFTSVDFYSDSMGYIGTNNGFLYKTIDGGNTWLEIPTPTSNLSITSIRFLNELKGFMSCDNNGGSTWIYKTNDGGLTWFLVLNPSSSASRLSGFNTLYLAGGYGLLLKTDHLQKPIIPGYINGPEKSCIGTTAIFNAGTIPGVEYHWSLSGGGVHKPNDSRDSVTWSSLGQYNLSLVVSNSCGVSATRTVAIEISIFQPSITVGDSILTATEGLAYQWYQNGLAVPALLGGTQRSLVVKTPASYSVQVKSLYGCIKTSPTIEYEGVSTSVCPDGNTSLSSLISSANYQWQLNIGTGSGFINVTNGGFFSGVNDSLLQLHNIPSSWYGFKFRCTTNKGFSNVYVLKFANLWNGASDNAWENPANWSCGKVPDTNTDVVINSGTVIINSNVTIRKLTLNPQVSLTVKPGKTLTITH